VKLLVLTVAATLAAGAAQASPAGQKAEKTGGEPICTTTTTVVRQGDVVLSTTSQTHCEEAEAQAPSPQGPQASASNRPHSRSPAAQVFGGSENMVAKVFGAEDAGLKPRDVLGIWSAVERGRQDACRVQMMRETSANGFRVETIGCRGALAHVTAWKFEETQAALYDSAGAAVTRLSGDKEHLSGVLADGRPLNLIR
jgi:hypothetical protein